MLAAPHAHIQLARLPLPCGRRPWVNQAGKKASVAIYNHLALKFDGRLTPAAAAEGLQLYAEVVGDAKARPGAHPNIDILLQVVSKHQQQQQQQQEGAEAGGDQQQQQQHDDISIVVTKL
jgi:hypothetical protein